MSRFIEISKGLHINADMIMEIVEEENYFFKKKMPLVTKWQMEHITEQ